MRNTINIIRDLDRIRSLFLVGRGFLLARGGVGLSLVAGRELSRYRPYIADARAGVLPLLGGNTGQSSPYGFHDWEYLLTEMGVLHLDQTLGRLSHFLGPVLMLLAIVWGLRLLLRQSRRLRRDV